MKMIIAYRQKQHCKVFSMDRRDANMDKIKEFMTIAEGKIGIILAKRLLCVLLLLFGVDRKVSAGKPTHPAPGLIRRRGHTGLEPKVRKPLVQAPYGFTSNNAAPVFRGRFFPKKCGHTTEQTMEGYELRDALGENLKTYRSLRNLSQAELAKRANISLTFLSDIERGNKWSYPETLTNLASALDVPVSILFTPKNNSPEDPGDDTIRQFSQDIRRQVDEALETIFRTYQVSVK
jgi:transcriptional regulator with XRE-family HTH domain